MRQSRPQHRTLISFLLAGAALSLPGAPSRAQGPGQETTPAGAPDAAPPPAAPAAPQVWDGDAHGHRRGQGQVENGFVIRASLGGRVGLTSTGTAGISSLLTGQTLQLGLFLGGKAGRVMVGAGLDYANLTDKPGSGRSTSVSTLVVTPEVQVAIVRSADRRVEMLADAALGLGGLIGDTGSSSTTFELTYQLGPGVRFWAHPNFAIQALCGFSGQAFFTTGSSTSGDTLSVHGIFAAAQLLAAF